MIDIFTMTKDKETAIVTYFNPTDLKDTKQGVIQLSEYPELLPLLVELGKAKASGMGYDLLTRAAIDAYRTFSEKSRAYNVSIYKLFAIFGFRLDYSFRYIFALLALKIFEAP